METRKPHTTRYSELPKDYVKMVNEVLTTNFDAGLKALKSLHSQSATFSTHGRIDATEISICVSLLIEGQLAATTVHASTDYDPKASAPTVQDLLGACVDAVGSLFGQLLDPKNKTMLEQVSTQTLSAMKDIPFEWTPVTLDRTKVFLKVDKSNPVIDKMTNDWLEKNDPDHKARLKQEHEETEKLFVTGPKKGLKGTSH